MSESACQPAGQCFLSESQDEHLRRPNATTGYHKIIVLGHAACRFYDVVFVVGNDFNPLQLYAERETPPREIRRVGVYGLYIHTAMSVGESDTGGFQWIASRTCATRRLRVHRTPGAWSWYLSAQHFITDDYTSRGMDLALLRRRRGLDGCG